MKRDDRPVVIAWIVFFLATSTLAFSLMRRDAGEGFGGFAYGGVPYFELKQLNGDVRTLHQLKGKVWLMHFISKDRNEPHADTLTALNNLQQQFGERYNFHIVTVSTERAHLTRINNSLDEKMLSNWFLLHGSEEEVQLLMRNGFRLDARKDLFYLDQMIFLIDQNATIRGFYKIDTAKQLPAIQRHLESLL